MAKREKTFFSFSPNLFLNFRGTVISKCATHAVFVLFAIDGYGHKEIGQQLGISEGTSKWHLSEARKFLQQKITIGATS